MSGKDTKMDPEFVTVDFLPLFFASEYSRRMRSPEDCAFDETRFANSVVGMYHCSASWFPSAEDTDLLETLSDRDVPLR